MKIVHRFKMQHLSWKMKKVMFHNVFALSRVKNDFLVSLKPSNIEFAFVLNGMASSRAHIFSRAQNYAT